MNYFLILCNNNALWSFVYIYFHHQMCKLWDKQRKSYYFNTYIYIHTYWDYIRAEEKRKERS